MESRGKEVNLNDVNDNLLKSFLSKLIILMEHNRFYFHSAFRILARDVNVGLPQQWFDAWEPSSESEVAFIFEDDTEVRD